MAHPESETDLGENDSTAVDDFPPPERKVITQPYDLSIKSLVEQWDDESLELPEMQREYVWDNPRASRLIESLLLNIPIPVLYFAETDEVKWEVIDGHQRIRSIVRFVKNEFALSSLQVLGDLNRRRFHQLPDREQRFLERRTLRAVVISNESHPNMKFEIFERLNTGAVVLNAQEIRNSLFRGVFNTLLRNLVTDEDFRLSIGTKAPRKRMVDEELLLRFFALRETLATYRPPLKRTLNTYMGTQRDADEEVLHMHNITFAETMTRVRDMFGDSAFREIDQQGRPVERSVNRALFDAEMLALSWATGQTSATRREMIRAVASLFGSQDFRDAISLATGDRLRTLTRVRLMVEALEESGMEFTVPPNVRDAFTQARQTLEVQKAQQVRD